LCRSFAAIHHTIDIAAATVGRNFMDPILWTQRGPRQILAVSHGFPQRKGTDGGMPRIGAASACELARIRRGLRVAPAAQDENDNALQRASLVAGP
jgi:hypothetical protein